MTTRAASPTWDTGAFDGVVPQPGCPCDACLAASPPTDPAERAAWAAELRRRYEADSTTMAGRYERTGRAV